MLRDETARSPYISLEMQFVKELGLPLTDVQSLSVALGCDKPSGAEFHNENPFPIVENPDAKFSLSMSSQLIFASG